MSEEQFERWEKLIVYQFRELHGDIETLTAKLDRISDQVIILKVKAAFWGAIVALIVSAIVSAITAKLVH